jgi:hypothetical protein
VYRELTHSLRPKRATPWNKSTVKRGRDCAGVGVTVAGRGAGWHPGQQIA